MDPVDPIGADVGATMGVVDGAWVTVNVAVAASVDPVAVTVYVPGDAGGTVNPMLPKPISPPTYADTAVPTFVVPKSMLSVESAGNPVMVATTVVPAGPCEGLNVMDGPCAIAIGDTLTANINKIRISIVSVALLKLFSISIKHFCNAIVPLPYEVAFP